MPVHGLEQLAQLSRNLKALESETQKALVLEVTKDSEAIADFNREYAILYGERPDGKEIQLRGYSQSYARWKRTYATYKNVAYVDLHRFGRFWKSVKFEHVASEFWRLRSSGVSYAADLFKRYGKLLGIRSKDLVNYAEDMLKPKLIEDIKRQLKR